MCSNSTRIPLLTVVFLVMGLLSITAHAVADNQIKIDCDYPGGNISVEKIEENNVNLHQDLRDTRGNWFYRNFCVRGTAGRTLNFHFTKSRAIGVWGPAYSVDSGDNWNWLGKEAVEKNSFHFDFGKHDDVRFCFAIPYQLNNLEQFLNKHKSHPHSSPGKIIPNQKGTRNLAITSGQTRSGTRPSCDHHSATSCL